MERRHFRDTAKVGLFVLGGLYSAAAADHIGEDTDAAIEYGIEGAVFTLGGLAIKAYEVGKEQKLETTTNEETEIILGEQLGEPSNELTTGESQTL